MTTPQISPDADPVRFDLTYKPPGFQPLDPNASGRWYLIEYPAGKPAGYVWTDNKDATGFITLDQERYPTQAPISGILSSAAMSGMTALAAYNTVASLAGSAVSGEAIGRLGNVVALSQNLDAPLPEIVAKADGVTAAAPPPQTDVPADIEDADASPVDPAPAKSPSNASIFVAEDDNENPLDLCMSDETGVYIRSNSAWFKLPNDDASLDGKVWQDVSNDAVQAWDDAEEKGTPLKQGDLKQYYVSASQ